MTEPNDLGSPPSVAEYRDISTSPAPRKRGRPRKVTPTIPDDLQKALGEAVTFEAVDALYRKLSVELASGKIERLLAMAVLDILNGRRQVLKLATKERELNRLTGVTRVLTANEVAALDAYNASVAPKPLGPTESAAIVSQKT